jgi:hypothetical protein
MRQLPIRPSSREFFIKRFPYLRLSIFFHRKSLNGGMPEAIREQRRTVGIGQFENSVWLEAKDLLIGVLSIGKAAGDVNDESIP